MELINPSIDVLEDLLVEEQVTDGSLSELIVYNDDFNTFEWVIECFIEVCNHTHDV